MEDAIRKPSLVKDAVRRPSFVGTMKTVLAGVAGIRRKSDHEGAAIKPLHLAVAAIIFVLLFIFTLLTVVRIVLS